MTVVVMVLAVLNGASQDIPMRDALRRAFVEDADSGAAVFVRWRATRPRQVDANVLIGVAQDLFEDGDSAAALAVLQFNTKAFPNTVAAIESLGWAYVAAGRLDEAAVAFRRSLAIDVYNPNTAKRLDWIDGLRRARTNPATVPDNVRRQYVGRYGPYAVTASQGRLVVRERGEQEHALLAMSETLFAVEGRPTVRLWFTDVRAGAAQKLLLVTFDGGVEEWSRTDD